MVSECVGSMTACCVFFTTATPEESLKTSPFKMFQLLLESDLNKISLLTTAAVIVRLAIICLTPVSRAVTLHHCFPVEVKLRLSVFHLVSLFVGGGGVRCGECTPWEDTF